MLLVVILSKILFFKLVLKLKFLFKVKDNEVKIYGFVIKYEKCESYKILFRYFFK